MGSGLELSVKTYNSRPDPIELTKISEKL